MSERGFCEMFGDNYTGW